MTSYQNSQIDLRIQKGKKLIYLNWKKGKEIARRNSNVKMY